MDARRQEREEMVDAQIRQRGILDERVLKAMLAVPRHHFVLEKLQAFAYADRPLPLGEDQTISQPYIVAFMCQALKLTGDEKVLEIGTGSGYQTAVLTLLAKEVYSIEIREDLFDQAEKNLEPYLSPRLHLRLGNGLLGWPETAPFDGIILSAAPPEIPKLLLDQLALGGKLIAPVGGRGEQTLVLVEKTPQGMKSARLMSVAFVLAKSKELDHEN